MSRIIRYEFMGSWLVFWLLSVTVIGIPLALLYLLNSTLRLDVAVDDPQRFVDEFRAGKWERAAR